MVSGFLLGGFLLSGFLLSALLSTGAKTEHFLTGGSDPPLLRLIFGRRSGVAFSMVAGSGRDNYLLGVEFMGVHLL